jgi:hypothetical protein
MISFAACNAYVVAFFLRASTDQTSAICQMKHVTRRSAINAGGHEYIHPSILRIHTDMNASYFYIAQNAVDFYPLPVPHTRVTRPRVSIAGPFRGTSREGELLISLSFGVIQYVFETTQFTEINDVYTENIFWKDSENLGHSSNVYL